MGAAWLAPGRPPSSALVELHGADGVKGKLCSGTAVHHGSILSESLLHQYMNGTIIYADRFDPARILEPQQSAPATATSSVQANSSPNQFSSNIALMGSGSSSSSADPNISGLIVLCEAIEYLMTAGGNSNEGPQDDDDSDDFDNALETDASSDPMVKEISLPVRAKGISVASGGGLGLWKPEAIQRSYSVVLF